jgi:hypothetical protein
LSNRSAAYAKAKLWKEALEDADSCVSLNEKFDKGKAAMLAGTIAVAFKCFVLYLILIVHIDPQI